MQIEMTRALTEKDRKVLHYEKRIGYVMSFIMLCFGGLFNLYYFVIKTTGHDYLMIGLVDFGILLLAYFVCNRINLKVNRDLKDNTKEILKRRVEKKIEETSYEVGSGALYIPGLGDTFPKLWGQKMREIPRYFVVAKENRYEVGKDMFDKLNTGNDFYVHFARHSETILIISEDV